MILGPRHVNLQDGVTLVELLIAITVLGILMALAIPSFETARNVNRLAAASNDLVGGLQLARMEAIRRNARVVFCRSTDGTACVAGAGNWGGWLVASDENGSGTFGDVALERLRFESVPAGVNVQASPALVTLNNQAAFRSDGFVYAAGMAPLTASVAACLASTKPPENRRRVSIRTGGRVAVVRENGAGACAQPVN